MSCPQARDGDLTFAVAVDYTDRSRTPDRRFVVTSTVVHVITDTVTDAHLAAAQFVAATRPADFMVTATTTVSITA